MYCLSITSFPAGGKTADQGRAEAISKLKVTAHPSISSPPTKNRIEPGHLYPGNKIHGTSSSTGLDADARSFGIHPVL